MKSLIYCCTLFCALIATSFAQTLVENPAIAPFYHGVASGDPTDSSVIIWTRYTPEDVNTTNEFLINWAVFSDVELNNEIVSGDFSTSSERDFTVKIDVQGLNPYTTYYYQFKDEQNRTSLIGRTKTAPNSNVENVRFAGASCSSIYSGYFNAYRRIAERNDIDAVIHIGDYIYDFPDEQELYRIPEDAVLEPINDPGDTLKNWRALHNYYKLDPDLRAAHQQHPWIIMWDNHDLYNPEAQGDSDSIINSIQAFYEWTPVREPAPDEFNRLYRKLTYGNLVDVLVLDVDLFRNDSIYFDLEDSVYVVNEPSGLDEEVDDSTRTMLGDEQLSWFKQELLNSTAEWRLICSQKPMGQWQLFGLPDFLPDDLLGINNYGFPFTTSTWDGYPYERQTIYEFMRDNNINNNIALSGDLHTFFFYDMVENPWEPSLYNVGQGGGKPVGAEFVPGSISRGNLDETLSGLGLSTSQDFANLVENAIRALNPHNVYMDFIHHGYGILDFRADAVTGEFWFSKILSRSDEERLDRAHKCLKGKNRWQRSFTRDALPALNPSDTDFAPFEEFNWEQLEQAIVTSVGIQNILPSAAVELSSIYPNPMKSEASFNLITDHNAEVTINVYDLAQGRLIQQLFKGEMNANESRSFTIDGAKLVSSGSYLLVAKGNGFVRTQRFVLSN